MWRVWVSGEAHSGIWWGKQTERDNMDIGEDWTIILKWILKH